MIQITFLSQQGSSWSWSHGSWIYKYLCNQWLSNPAHSEVYSIQHYVIKLVS